MRTHSLPAHETMDYTPTTLSIFMESSTRIKFLIFADWVLKTEQSVIGDSLSYLDMMERTNMEENRRARERQIMEEGL